MASSLRADLGKTTLTRAKLANNDSVVSERKYCRFQNELLDASFPELAPNLLV